jgi:predicted transcriptional regulator
MSREDPQLKLRLTEDMKATITEAAQANGRSVNSEIVARLSDTLSLDKVSDFPGFSAAEKASMLHDQLEQTREKLKRSVELPDSLRARIDRRASETGRTAQEEAVLALEAAFPPASETDEMIRILGELLGENPQAVETIAGDAIRQYLDYLQEERAAGRAEGARARLQEVFEKTPDGRTVRRK